MLACIGYNRQWSSPSYHPLRRFLPTIVLKVKLFGIPTSFPSRYNCLQYFQRNRPYYTALLQIRCHILEYTRKPVPDIQVGQIQDIRAPGSGGNIIVHGCNAIRPGSFGPVIIINICFNIDMIFITLLVEGYGCCLKALGGIQGSDRDLGLLCYLTGLGSGQLHQVSFMFQSLTTARILPSAVAAAYVT